MSARHLKELALLALLAVAAMALHVLYSVIWTLVMLWLLALGQG